MPEYKDCIYHTICDSDAHLLLTDLDCTKCKSLEIEHVKCEYGCVKTRIVADENTGCHAIIDNTYCPKCGHRIEVKE
jgi:hypothetical protein